MIDKSESFVILEICEEIMKGCYEMEIYACNENGLRCNATKSILRCDIPTKESDKLICIANEENGISTFRVLGSYRDDNGVKVHVNDEPDAVIPFTSATEKTLNGENLLVFNGPEGHFAVRGTSNEYPATITTRNQLADVIHYYTIDIWYEDVADMINRTIRYVPFLRFPVKDTKKNEFTGEELDEKEIISIMEDSSNWEHAKEFMFGNGCPDDYILFDYKGKKYCAKYMTDPTLKTELDGEFLSDVLYDASDVDEHEVDKALAEYEKTVNVLTKELKEYDEYLKEHPEERLVVRGNE